MHCPRFRCCAGLTFSVAMAVALRAPGATEYHVSVDVTDPIRTVDDRHFGLDATIWDGEFANGTTTELLAAAGTRALRFGGGSLSDEYHWATNTTLDNSWEWATSFDDFADVATAIDAQVFVTTNYGTGTPEEAASWVEYSNITKGYGFKYWEVGNENYGTWETDRQAVPHDPYTYAVRFKQYMDQMKAVDPAIKVGAVVVNGEDSNANNTMHPATNPRTNMVHNGWTPVLLTTLKSIGAIPDFVIYHRYDQAPGAESDAGLLQSSKTWANDAADLRQQLNDYLGTDAAGVEMVVTENNSVYSNPGKQTTSIVNGLFMADSFGNLLQTEFNALMWWDVRNGQDTGNNNSASLYGWRNYGDYGVLTGPSGAYPTYYIHKLLQHFARAGDKIVSATCDDDRVSAFAALGPDDTVRILLVAKYTETPENKGEAWISIRGFDAGTIKTRYSYGYLEDEAARTGVDSPDVKVENFEPSLESPGSQNPGGIYSVVNVVPLTGYTATVLVFPPAKPWFNVQPISQTIFVNKPLSLVAEVGGSSESTVQWFRNGVAIPGATSETYTVIRAGQQDSGVYTIKATTGGGTVTSSPAVVVVGPRNGRLYNLSTRGPVHAGNDLMIAGFYVAGSSPHTVLIRGIGPALGSYGVNPATVLNDPHLTLYSGQTPIAENDDWEAQMSGGPDVAPVAASVGAFPLDPGSKDASLVATLNPGGYTVQLTGTDGGTGIGLVELYDAAQTNNNSTLVNLSTRGFVGVGNSLIIPGIYVGEAGRTLLIRGVGPGMPGAPTQSLLPDPVITLVDSAGNEIATNDDWGSTATTPELAAAMTSVGAFPLVDGSKDSAMLITLPPGSFTVLVRDKNGASGLAIVEVYQLAP